VQREPVVGGERPVDGPGEQGGAVVCVRSFAAVFALERRLYKVDRWRLPFPYGVPLPALAYGVLCALALLVAGRTPGVGVVVHLVPAPLRLVIGPAALGALAARVRVDARPAHRFAAAWVRHRLAPRHVSAFRAARPPGAERLGDVVLAADPSAVRYRAARIGGPARVLLRHPARARVRGSRLDVEPRPGEAPRRGTEITIPAGAQLRVRHARFGSRA
jgi:hypothetical protein